MLSCSSCYLLVHDIMTEIYYSTKSKTLMVQITGKKNIYMYKKKFKAVNL